MWEYVIISSLIRGDRVRGLYSKWKSSIWTSISFNTRIINPAFRGGGVGFLSWCQWNGFRRGYKDADNCIASSSSSPWRSSSVDSGGVVILDAEIDLLREGLAGCRPSCGWRDTEANVKSARMSLSCRSVKFQNTTTPYENRKTAKIRRGFGELTYARRDYLGHWHRRERNLFVSISAVLETLLAFVALHGARELFDPPPPKSGPLGFSAHPLLVARTVSRHSPGHPALRLSRPHFPRSQLFPHHHSRLEALLALRSPNYIPVRRGPPSVRHSSPGSLPHQIAAGGHTVRIEPHCI